MVGEESFRVCKSFYLSTLAISQKIIFNLHGNKDPTTAVLKADGRGRKSSKKVSDDKKEKIKAHIRSFPVVDSGNIIHNSRAKTKQKVCTVWTKH